jgi:hypothetical protein
LPVSNFFLLFEPSISVTAEGKWELKDASGKFIDGMSEENEDFAYAKQKAICCNQILGKIVKDFEISAPNSFSLHFESGHVLIFFDDLGPYECINIQPGDIYM